MFMLLIFWWLFLIGVARYIKLAIIEGEENEGDDNCGE